MASDAGIIKEFLVALGFKVDDKKLKDFTGGIDRATQFVGKLAVGVEAMATAATAAIVKVSERFEDLYYASIRMSDSVENIRATTFAIGQLGGTAQGGLQALENLGEFFRSNPGGERFVQSLGVQTRAASGELRGMTEILKDLGPVLRSMPYYRAKVVGGVLGIDPRTLQALLRDTGEASSRFHDLAQRMGVDQDKAAKASHDFMNDVRELLAVLTLTADKIILKIQPVADKVVHWFEAMDEATQGWSTSLFVLAAALLPLLLVLDPLVVAGAALVAGFYLLVTQFDDASAAGGGFAGALKDLWEALGEVWAIFKPFGEYIVSTFGPVLADAARLFVAILAANLRAMADVLRIIVDLLTGQWSKAWTDAGKLATDTINNVTELAKKSVNVLRDFWNAVTGRHDGASAANDNRVAAVARGVSKVAGGAGAHIQDFLQQHGLSGAQAQGATAGIYAESKFNPNAVNPTSGAYGIGQWLGRRKAELFRRYGPNPTLDQQLEFLVSELAGSEASAGQELRGQTTRQGALSIYIRKFMRPGPGTSSDLNRGLAYLSSPPALSSSAPAGGASKPVSVAQTTTITVQGSADPHATAKAVSAEQARVNEAMVRNLKVAAS